MGFTREVSENQGWNSCLDYLLNNLENFHNNLTCGEYDYFPEDDIREELERLRKK